MMEKGLDTELNNVWLHYKNTDTGNSRNGCSSKRLRTNFGEVDVSVPRDRKGEFEPRTRPASARTFRRKSCLCIQGMSTGDIEALIHNIYGISASDSMVRQVTGKILPIAKEWHQRPSEFIYGVVFLDGRKNVMGM